MSKKQNPSQKPSEQPSVERKSFEPWETPMEVASNRAKANELAKKELEELRAKKRSAINKTKD